MLHARVRGLVPSATFTIQERSAALEAQGRRITRFGLGQSPFPVPEPVVAALREHAGEKDYLPVRGLPALRQAVARFHRQTQGLDVQAEQVLIAPGSKELLFLLQLVCDAELLLPSPSWVSYAPQAGILGRPVCWLDTAAEDGWRLAPATLDAHCRGLRRPRILVLNSPNNPTGMSYGADRLAELAEVARDHGVWVLSDEIYGEVHHTGQHATIATFYPEGTFITGGLSKWCGAGGWRLGTMVVPDALASIRDAIGAVASETFSAVAAPIQYAAVTAFHRGPEIADYVHHGRRVLRALGGFVAATLSSVGVQVDRPEGGFYSFPDATPLAPRLAAVGIADSRSLAARALEATGVAFLPGVVFGRPPEELTARLAWVAFDGGAALEASARQAGPLDDAFLRDWCGDVVDGVSRLAAWLDHPR